MRRFMIMSAIFFVSLTCLISCNKGDNAEGSSTAIAKEFFTVTGLLNANNNPEHSLNAYETSGALRWRKQNWGVFIPSGFAADKHVLYVFGAIETSYNVYPSKLAAINIDTGAELWTTIINGQTISEPIVRNDTIFCSIGVTVSSSASIGYIAALDAKSGNLLWKTQVTTSYWPRSLVLDGNTIFYLASNTSAATRLTSFDIPTKTINWVSSLGIAFLTSSSYPEVSSDKIFISDNLRRMRAFNKTTGALEWTSSTRKYDQPVYSNGLLYTESVENADWLMNGITCLDPGTGAEKWHWRSQYLSTPNYSDPFRFDNKLIFADSDSAGQYIKAFNPSTGAQIWRTGTSDQLEYVQNPIGIGKRIYSLNKNIGTDQARFFTYNSDTGKAMDSTAVLGRDIISHFFVARHTD